MSKKIKIPSINIKSSLVSLFHSFLENESKRKRNRVYDYDDYDEEMAYWVANGYIFDMDDEDLANYYEDGDVIWPPMRHGKKSNKHSRSNKKKDIVEYADYWNSRKGHKGKHRNGCRVIDITQPYSGDEDDPDEVGDYPHEFDNYEEVEDNGITNGKEIFYYPDYHNKDDRLEFNTLKSFSEFCEDNGYAVSESVANDISYRRVSHCCLSPIAREYGLYEIMCEESYGTLFYEVCESSELD